MELKKAPKRRTEHPSCYNRFCKKKKNSSRKKNLAKKKDLPENQKIQLRDISKGVKKNGKRKCQKERKSCENPRCMHHRIIINDKSKERERGRDY